MRAPWIKIGCLTMTIKGLWNTDLEICKDFMCNKYRLILCYSVKQTFKDGGDLHSNNKESVLSTEAFTNPMVFRE